MIRQRRGSRRPDREAAAWFTRLSDTPVEADDLSAFDAWRQAPANDEAYRRLEDVSGAMAGLRGDPAVRAAVAAARRPARPGADGMVGLGGARRGGWALGLAVAGVLAIGVSVTILTGLRPNYETQVGQQMATVLRDGSRVRLNTDTALRVRFSSGERRVELLRGQAFFDVAHDTARPFIVVAGDTRVRAVGTRFDVRRDGDVVRVVLAQGKVRVSDRDAPGRDWTLAPGQGLAVAGDVAKVRPAATDVAARTEWTDGRITFDDVPLAAAVAEINRYSARKIVLGDGVPANARVSGGFKVGDTDPFLAAVTAIYGLRAERTWDGRLVLSGPATPAA